MELLPPSQPCLAKRGLVEDGEVARLLDEFGVEVEVEVEAAVGFGFVNLLGHEQVSGVVVPLGLNQIGVKLGQRRIDLAKVLTAWPKAVTS